MRVCLDTNILVSGIFWKGLPGKVIELWMGNRFDLVASPLIFDEYQKTVRKIGYKINPAQAETWVQIIAQKALLISLMPMKRCWSRDPDDDKFIHCALAGKADYLISGDKDLIILKGQVPVKIVTARQFLNLR